MNILIDLSLPYVGVHTVQKGVVLIMDVQHTHAVQNGMALLLAQSSVRARSGQGKLEKSGYII